jgi:hypothetical protein
MTEFALERNQVSASNVPAAAALPPLHETNSDEQHTKMAAAVAVDTDDGKNMVEDRMIETRKRKIEAQARGAHDGTLDGEGISKNQASSRKRSHSVKLPSQIVNALSVAPSQCS